MTTRIVTDANGRKHITNEPLLHPPKREWVGLTEQEETEILLSSNTVYGAMKLTETKLMEKNK